MLAVLLGAALWVFVTDTENPTVIDLFRAPIPVQAVNVGENLAVANHLASVDIRIAAPRDRWDRLSVGSFRATVDLKGLDAREQQVRVQVEPTTSGVRVVEVIPRSITVNLEDFVEKSIPVIARLVGTLPIGYELGAAKPAASSVKVSGPHSLVELVKEVVADVNITGLTVDVDPAVSLVARGAGGGEIRGVRIAPESVRVNVQVIQRTLFRTLPLTVRVTGEPAVGYRLANVTISPAAVQVQGSIQALQQLDSLTLPPVDVSGLRSDVSRPLRIALPPGVSTTGEPQATVSVAITAITGSARFSVAPVLENTPAGRQAAVDQPAVVVVVQGPIPKLDALTPADIRVTLDLRGLGDGTSNVVPRIRVPDGLTVLSVQPLALAVTLRPS